MAAEPEPEPASADGGPAHGIPVRPAAGAEAAPAADAPSQGGGARPEPDAEGGEQKSPSRGPDPEPGFDEPEREPAAEGAAPDSSADSEPAHGTPPHRAAEGAANREGGRRRRIALVGAAVAVAVAVVAGVLVAGGGHHTRPAAARVAADGLQHTAVDISPGTCGRGWGTAQKPHPGTQAFDLHNSAAGAIEVYLEDPRTGRLYAEIEGLAPGTTRSMTVDLGSGRYAFECQQEDTDAVTGPTVTVPGNTPQGPSSLPVTVHDLIPPTLDYQKWIQARMAELSTDTATLKADIDRGDLTEARHDWLTGHLAYERMGAAYDTFGTADGVINGTTTIGQDPLKDPHFTGFHRIEYGLWHHAPATSLRAPAATLDTAVKKLTTQWKTQQMDPANMGLRAHEIIENAEQFELTGRTDYGSGTNLATASADIDGTREILTELHPLLATRDKGLNHLQTSLQRTQTSLKSLDHAGHWTPLDQLTRTQREQINADFGDLLEQLAPVAAIFDVRRTV